MKMVMTKQEIENFMKFYSVLSRENKECDSFYNGVKRLVKEYGDVNFEEFFIQSWSNEDCVEIGCTTAPLNEYIYALGEDSENATLSGFSRFIMNYMALVSNPLKLRNMTKEQIAHYICAGVDLTF